MSENHMYHTINYLPKNIKNACKLSYKHTYFSIWTDSAASKSYRPSNKNPTEIRSPLLNC